jgi:hypothetical protein
MRRQPHDSALDGEEPAASECCRVPMRDGKPCGRRSLGAVTDGIPYCLMHTPLGKDNAAFQEEFERVLRDAGQGVADFTRFVFPAADFAKREFKSDCCFYGARFMQDADFGLATFTQTANFYATTFTQTANFYAATFTQGADFGLATFTQGADFHGATLTQDADFSEAKFTHDADFSEATFTQDANFSEATFTQDAHFNGATFTRNADFIGATFTQDGDFFRTTFTRDAHFIGATFARDAYFSGATFTQSAHFLRTTFTRAASFMQAKFLGAAEFREARFRGHDKDDKARVDDFIPGPAFSLAEFSQPEKVLFYKTYLGQALFHDCDVSKVVFSSVEWRWRPGTRKRVVFDEYVELPKPTQVSDRCADALKPGGRSADERDYGLIAELYQQLKKNYDDKKDYWTAGDFHYGEMEMKRLASRRKSPVLRWLHRHLGLVGWYKYASQYGESYLRPALWLLGVLLLFACMYPFVGLQYDPTRDRPQPKPTLVVPAPQPAKPPSNSTAAQSPHVAVLTYSLPFRPGEDTHGSRSRARLRLAWHSLWASVFVALFQKELVYEPVYLWGRVLAVLEQALTSTLFALFILAVRRQFRR